MKLPTHTAFLSREIRQTEEGFRFWESFLAKQNFKRLIELGTCPGFLSVYLYLYCIEKGKEFYTYDKQDCGSSPVKDLINFRKVFNQLDIKEYVYTIGGLIRAKGQTILFCDDGDKEWEINTFSEFLKSGDIILTHDWINEVNPLNIQEALIKYGLEDFDEDNDPSKTFIKVWMKK